MKKLFTLIAFAVATLTASATTIVNEYKVWTFDEQTSGETVNSLKDFNGLYIRSTANHTATYVDKKRSGTFSNGWKYKNTAVGLKLQANTALAPAADLIADTECKNTNDRSIAITTGVAGTFYIVFVSEYAKADRDIQLFFDGEKVKSIDAKSVYDNKETGRSSYFEYHASQGGTFLFGGSASTVCYVMFVPEGYTPTDIAKPTINKGTHATSQSYNISGEQVADSFKGLVVLNGKKFIKK